MSQTSSNPSNEPCSDASIPELIDLVEAYVNKQLSFWQPGGIYVAKLFSNNGYRIDIWNRAAGVLTNNKWYAWAKPDKPLIPIHAANPRFFRQIVEDCRAAFIRSGEDIYWNRAYPTK